jgi:hypothetical protein
LNPTAYKFSKQFIELADKVKDEKTAFEFVKMFGSHYVSRAKMGARFEENYYFSEEASSSEITKARSKASEDSMSFSASVKGSGGGWGVSVSASASHSNESKSASNSSNRDSKAQE